MHAGSAATAGAVVLLTSNPRRASCLGWYWNYEVLCCSVSGMCLGVGREVAVARTVQVAVFSLTISPCFGSNSGQKQQETDLFPEDILMPAQYRVLSGFARHLAEPL